jgi:hypothetical protein
LTALATGVRRRSPASAALAVGIVALELGWPAYRRFKRDARFADLNLVSIFREPGVTAPRASG